MNDSLGSQLPDLDEARELYFKYDGSRFYMSRDGVDRIYHQAAVPEEVEEAWLAELTATKLDALRLPGNWRTVQFLAHHGDFRHTALLVATEPLGEAVDKVAYLEELLNYARSFRKLYGKPLSEQDAVIAAVAGRAGGWMPAMTDGLLMRRLQQVLDETVRRRDADAARPLPEGASRPGGKRKKQPAMLRVDKLCNAFYPDEAATPAEETASGKRGKSRPAGVWIGGRLAINDRCLSFVPSRMKEQAEARMRSIEIPLEQVTAVSREFGLMTGIVTVQYGESRFTFRCFGAKRIAQQLQGLIRRG